VAKPTQLLIVMLAACVVCRWPSVSCYAIFHFDAGLERPVGVSGLLAWHRVAGPTVQMPLVSTDVTSTDLNLLRHYVSGPLA